jgi:hypothetical protein
MDEAIQRVSARPPPQSALTWDQTRRGGVLDGKRFTAFVVFRRYRTSNLHELKRLGTAQGGKYVDGTHWSFAGQPGQIAPVTSELLRAGRDPRPVLLA